MLEGGGGEKGRMKWLGEQRGAGGWAVNSGGKR